MANSPLLHSVRMAELTDIPKLLLIEHSAFVESDGKLSRRAFRYHIASSNLFLVATPLGGAQEISGYILVFLRKKSARIYSLATAAEYGQQGVAKSLLAASLKSLSGKSVTRINLELRVSNTAARMLYDSFGFELSRVRQGYYGDGEPALCMTRNIIAPQDL